MKKWYTITLTIIFVLVCGSLQGLAEQKAWVSGYLRNQTDIRLIHDNDIMRSWNQLDLRFNYELTGKFKAFFELRPGYDAAFDIQSEGIGNDDGLKLRDRGIGVRRNQIIDGPFPGSFKEGLRNNWDTSYMRENFFFRECWISGMIGNLEYKLGKQQEAWGETDGIQLMDILNPIDCRDWQRMSMEDQRIPIWMANLKYWFNPSNAFQFVWMPKYVSSFFASPGSVWAPSVVNSIYLLSRKSDFLGPGSGTTVRIREDKPDSFSAGDYAFRYTGNMGFSLDYSFAYLHKWNPINMFPEPDSRYQGMTPFGPVPGYDAAKNQMVFVEKPKRLDIFGFAITATLPTDLVVRSEFVYIKDNVFTLDDGFSSVVTKDNIKFVIGLDKDISIFDRFYSFSFQYFENIILGDPTSPITRQEAPILNTAGGHQRKEERLFTILVSTDFANERWLPSLFIIWNSSYAHDTRLNPSLTYVVNDKFKVKVGADIYTGRKTGLFGDFRDNKPIYFDLKYEF